MTRVGEQTEEKTSVYSCPVSLTAGRHKRRRPSTAVQPGQACLHTPEPSSRTSPAISTSVGWLPLPPRCRPEFLGFSLYTLQTDASLRSWKSNTMPERPALDAPCAQIRGEGYQKLSKHSLNCHRWEVIATKILQMAYRAASQALAAHLRHFTQPEPPVCF